MSLKSTKKVGRPKGRKDTKPRKKKRTFAERQAAARKAAETRRRKKTERAETTSKGATAAAPAPGVEAQDAPGSTVIPHPRAGDNPAFAAFLKDEAKAGETPGDTAGPSDAGPPSAWTPESVRDAYKGIGEMIAAVSGEPTDKLQPYELRLLSGPNNVRFINAHLGPDRGPETDAWIFAGTNAIILGPRITRNAKPLYGLAKKTLINLAVLLGVPVHPGKKPKTDQPRKTSTDGFGSAFTPDDE